MPASIADPSPTSKEAHMLLERKLLDLAFGKVKFSVIAALLLASLIVLSLWSVIEHERLLAWLAGIAAVKVLQVLYLHRYQRHGHRADVDPGKWKAGLVIGAAAAGLGWGCTVFCFPSSPFNPMTLFGVFVLPSTPFDPVTVLLIFILAGVTAYASVALAFVPRAAFAFFACAWLPLAIWLFSFGEQMYVVMGLIALSYLGVMVMLSRRMYATVCSLISVTEENRGLRTAQQEHDQRMARFFENAPGFFYTAHMGPDGKTSWPFASAGIRNLFDVTVEEMKESITPLISLLCADDIEPFIVAREVSRKNLSPLHLEFRINHSLKGQRWIELSSLPQREADGATVWHGFMQDITERKQTERYLENARARLQTVMSAIPDMIWLKDADGAYLSCNPAFERFFGASEAEIIGKTDFDFVDTELADFFRQKDQEAIAAGRVCVNEESITYAADGRAGLMETRKVPVLDHDGKVVGVLGVARDITEIRDLQQRQTQYFAAAPGLFATLEQRADGSYAMPFVSDGIRDLYGLEPEDVMRDIGALVARAHPDDIEMTFRKTEESARDLTPYHVEYRIIHPSRGLRWLEVRSMPQRLPDGGTRWNGFYHDITERKRMEQTLAASEEKHRTVFESANDGIFLHRIVERDGNTEFVLQDLNQKGCELWGHSREDILAGNFDLLAMNNPPYSFEEATRRNRLAAAGEPQLFDWELKRGDGSKIWGEVNLRRIEIGGEAFLQSVMRDLNERKAMEDALAESQMRYRQIFDNAQEGMFLLDVTEDRRFRVIESNPTFARLIGIPRDGMIGRFVDEILLPETAQKVSAKYNRCIDFGDVYSEEQELQLPVGLHTYHTTLVPVRGEGGRIVRLVGITNDITERKQAEEALRESGEKLRSLYEYSPVGIALTGMDGRYIEFNEAFRAICAYPHDELMELDYWTLTPREYEAQEMAQIDSLEKTGRYGPYVKEYVRKDGSRVPIQLNGSLIIGKDMTPYIWSIVEDISERKKNEALLKNKFERILELNDYLEENARTLEEHAVELEASQEQLKEALEFSNGVINAIPDILFEMDREGRYHGIWTQQPELLAAQKARLLNKTVHEVLPPEAAAAAMAGIREADENGTAYGKVIAIAQPNGGVRWFDHSIARKHGNSPSDTRFIVLSRDVTERRRTEDVLRFIAQGEWLMGGEAFPNALVRYLGKLLGVDYVVIDKFAADTAYAETVALYAKGEVVPNMQYGLLSTPCGEVMAGRLCCYHDNVQGQFPEAGLLREMQAESYVGLPLWDVDGKVIGLIAALDRKPMTDTHSVKSVLQVVASSVAAELQRNLMEQVLRESYDALNEAQRISHIGNWELDLSSGALVWSDEIYRIFEIDPERFGASYDAFINVIHPDDREAVNCAYSESLASREPYEIEHRLLFADGRIKYVHERCETHYAEDGKPMRSLGTVQDITVRKQAEESLRESYEKISELNRHLEKNATRLEENARHLEEQTTELEASQGQLKQTEAWYRSILHSAPEGMLVVDDQGLIMQVNARLEAMFGYESGELPGHRVEDLLPHVVRETHAEQRAGYFASGAVSQPAMSGKTLFGCRKDGSTFPVDVSLSRLPELDGRRSAVCASVRDITERQEMEVARETALAEAQRLAQLRSAFMAQMSHELRTPLNGILGYTQNLLQGDALGEKQVAGLNIIQHSGEHLLSLINGLLDHAAIEANKFELIEGDIELDPFLSAIIGMIRVRAEQKNIAFTCDAGSDLPAIVRGDAQRLRQVLINLLANAVKFTDNGDVILRVRLTAPTRIRFEVQDSGVGIAADQLESIFLPFEQTGELHRRAGGSGLGLAISHKLVRLMGGDIRVESQLGAGSTFSFEIEIGIVQSGQAGLDAAALSERAETRVAQATSMLPAPPRQELDTLHALAQRGSMRDVMRHADRLAEADARYQPFAAQLRRLAQSFQTKALLGLIEQYRNREQEE